MFCKDITGSDAFMEMPSSTQALYFHLGMEADDDGFVGNPKKLAKLVGTSEDDMKILIAKRFVLVFPSGVLVIKHHRMNNNWDKYNCRRTVYTEEFSKLYIKENMAYTLDSLQGTPVQSDDRLIAVFRRDKNRVDNSSDLALPNGVGVGEPEKPQKEKKDTTYLQVFGLCGSYPLNWKNNRTEVAAAKNILLEHGLEKAKKALEFFEEYKDYEKCPQILKPSDLDRKWVNLVQFKRKI